MKWIEMNTNQNNNQIKKYCKRIGCTTGMRRKINPNGNFFRLIRRQRNIRLAWLGNHIAEVLIQMNGKCVHNIWMKIFIRKTFRNMTFGKEIVSSKEYFNHGLNHINWSQTATGNWFDASFTEKSKMETYLYLVDWPQNSVMQILFIVFMNVIFVVHYLAEENGWRVSGGLLTFFQWNVLIPKPKREPLKTNECTTNEHTHEY